MIHRLIKNKYQIIEKIAEGGMSTVYSAQDLKDKKKKVAIKVLKNKKSPIDLKILYVFVMKLIL